MKDQNASFTADLQNDVLPDLGLDVVQALFKRLHIAELRYCHWKSNEHVGPAVNGQTDLDVLVDQGRTDDLQRILAESGFRRFQATSLTAYHGVEDYLALDDATGKIVHLHLHHRLTIGQMHLKGYRLPWEDLTLATRHFDAEHGLYVASPQVELLLLLVRDALKLRLRSRIKRWLRKTPAKGDFAREFAWLVARCEIGAVNNLATRLIGADALPPLERILRDGAQHADRAAFAAVARHALRQHRTYGPVSAAVLGKLREAAWITGGLSKRYFHWAVPLRRVSPRGGVAVAFLGSDGAGKSTLLADTITWLGQKLDVVPIYFGSGDGPGSLLRAPLQLARKLIDRRAPSTTPTQRRTGRRGRLRSVALVPWALSLSLEKRAKHKRMIRARNRGMMVICDRYPQDQIDGFNDGRLLAHLAQSPNRILRALATWEAQPYTRAYQCPPDIVIKLIASPEVALERRPEMSRDEIERRVDAVRALAFPAETQVAEIDADQPLADVIAEVRRLIWGNM
jgi:thymidylate kinase